MMDGCPLYPSKQLECKQKFASERSRLVGITKLEKWKEFILPDTSDPTLERIRGSLRTPI